MGRGRGRGQEKESARERELQYDDFPMFLDFSESLHISDGYVFQCQTEQCLMREVAIKS